MRKNSDNHLIHESKKIVQSLGKMFAPFCEVVLHDLRTPAQAIIAIENNFSGRKIGDATTNVGLERVVNDAFPEVLQNYQNILPNGKVVKSTSIGIKNEEGHYIASICLNFDTSVFSQLNSQLAEFITTKTLTHTPTEQLRSLSSQEVEEAVSQFAHSKNETPQSLDKNQKRELILLLEEKGLLQLRNAISTVATLLGVTRPTIYNYLKSKE